MKTETPTPRTTALCHRLRDDPNSSAPEDVVTALEHAAELERENITLREDKHRLDHLEDLIRQCPHAVFDFSDDPDEDKHQGFSIEVDGCDPTLAVGKTLREAIDEDHKFKLSRNSE